MSATGIRLEFTIHDHFDHALHVVAESVQWQLLRLALFVLLQGLNALIALCKYPARCPVPNL